MKRFLLSALLILGCSACAAGPVTPTTPTSDSVELAGHHFNIELATTFQQRAQGLMNRTSMPADHGMLFVFAHQAPQTFWMKDTLIPLDMLYFDKDRKLVSMQLNAPPCKGMPCPTFPSNAPAKYVLELNAGTAMKIGAKVGDVLTIHGHIGHVDP